MILSAHQPNFFPYLGFFYKIFRCDTFVILDHVQYSKNEFQSRNMLKINDRRYSFFIPVKYAYPCPINEVNIIGYRRWADKAMKTFQMNYRKAGHFEEAYDFLRELLSEDYGKLSDLNVRAILEISRRLGLDRKFLLSSSMALKKKKDDMIIELCKIEGADGYYSGTGGESYNDPTKFEAAGIRLIYTDYIPETYEQTGDGFIENLSILDWIFNKGFAVPDGWRK